MDAVVAGVAYHDQAVERGDGDGGCGSELPVACAA